MQFVLLLLILYVTLLVGAWKVGDFYGDTAGALVSCIIALVLPILTIFFATKALEDEEKKSSEGPTDSQTKSSNPYRNPSQNSDKGKTGTDNRLIFLECFAGLMARISKADGHIDKSEIQAIEDIFERLGFTLPQRNICISFFRHTLTSSATAEFYARRMCSIGMNYELRRLVYELLWDIACADGVLAQHEKVLLQALANALKLNEGIFDKFYSERVRADKNYSNPGRGNHSIQSSELQKAYEVLGCSDKMTITELTSRYRNLAKKLHPDILRAQGMPEALINKANERMAEINAAWEIIKRTRNDFSTPPKE